MIAEQTVTQTGSEATGAFAYQAQTPEGVPISGTIDAADAQQASALLQQLRLRVMQIEPVARPPRGKALRGEDFLAFNQQLTHLTRAGLPVEHGLKLIAQDMRSTRLGTTVRQVAEELERGQSLEAAFEKYRDRFPPLYAKLIASGVATSDLPGMLLNLGRHVELVYRLRATLWRAAAYPLMVLAGLAVVLAFLAFGVIPQFRALFADFGVQLPALTLFMLSMPDWAPWVIAVVLLIVIGVPLTWAILRAAGKDRWALDTFLLPLPLIGTVLKRNLIARWCDAVRMGVQAGFDLPRAIGLADDAVGSPRLRRDGQTVVAAIEGGRSLDSVIGQTRLLPATVLAAMALPHRDLAETLASLSDTYQQQAEVRLTMIPMLLTPLLIVLLAAVIGFIVAALFLPFITMIQTMTGG